MSLYARVENGVVTEQPQKQPTVIKNILNPKTEILKSFGWFIVVDATYEPTTQTLGVAYWDEASGVVRRDAIDRDIPPIDKKYIEQIIMDSARDYRESKIYAEGLILVERLVIINNIKGIETEEWINTLWMDAYQRVGVMLNTGEWDGDTDFSVHGDKPYTIAILTQELGITGELDV